MFTFFRKKNTDKSAHAGAYFVFDVGGTNMRVAKAQGDALGDVIIRPTPKDPSEGISLLVALGREVLGGAPLREIVGCIAGNVDSKGAIFGARNLRSWEGMNIIGALSQELGAPAFVMNDCELEGLGEAHYGAGKGAGTLAYITVSTGVGGARIAGGKIDFAASAFVVGRIPVEGADLEDTISGTAIKKKFGVEPKDLSSTEERVKLAATLGQALFEVVERWHPDTIVIGGSMITGKQNTLPLGVVQAELMGKMRDSGASVPAIRKALLGNEAGLLGAHIFAKGQR